MTYELEGSTLLVSASVVNAGRDVMPSLGFHPAFRWPLPGGGAREAHEIRFEAPEPEPVSRLVGGLLGSVPHPTPVEGNRPRLRDGLFDDGGIVFDWIANRIVHYGVPGRSAIRGAFPGLPHLGVWTQSGAGFICIEPWHGFADPEDFDGEHAEKPGSVLLAAGGTQTFEMAISVTPSDQ